MLRVVKIPVGVSNDVAIVGHSLAKPDTFGPLWQTFQTGFQISKNCFTVQRNLSRIEPSSRPLIACHGTFHRKMIVQPSAVNECPCIDWVHASKMGPLQPVASSI